MNALSQMAFGWGHRIVGEPDVNIFFGTKEQVRAFRTRASKLAADQPTQILSSDFPHTMVGASTDELLANVVNTPEAEITYFGACCIAAELDAELDQLLESCFQIKNYKPHLSELPVSYLLPPEVTDPQKQKDLPPKKIVMLLPTKASLAELLNPAVLAALQVAGKVPYNDQYLLSIGNPGPGAYQLVSISYHSNVILKTSPENHSQITTNLATSTSPPLFFSTMMQHRGGPPATVVFGDLGVVEHFVPKDNTRLFSDELGKKDLVPAVSPHSTKLKLLT